MEIIQVVGLGIIVTVIILVIKAQRPEIGVQISILAGIIIFLMIAGKLSVVLKLIIEFAQKTDVDMSYVGVLLKIIGIAYIAEFGAEICKDAGEASMASKIELAGKVLIVILAVPIISSLMELIIKILP